MSEIITISSIDDVFDLQEKWDGNLDNIKFTENAIRISIKVEGENYHASFPASFACGLAELQNNLYRSIAFSLYGKADRRKLTKDELKQYELIFTVKPGCTDFAAEFANGLYTFLLKVTEGMSPTEKIFLIISLFGLFVTGWVVVSKAKASSEVGSKKIDADERVDVQREHTRQLEVMANVVAQVGSSKVPQIVSSFEVAAQESAEAIVKGAVDANSLSIGNVHFDKDDIEQINQRSTKSMATAEIVTGKFKITQVGAKDSDVTRFTLLSESNREISAKLDNEEFALEEINKIWEHAKSRTRLHLSVNITMINDEIKDARIVEIDPDIEQ